MNISTATTVLMLLILTATGCVDSDEYTQSIEDERSRRDMLFKYGDTSPLPEEQKKQFHGLHYFPPDEQFAVTAEFREDVNVPSLKLTIADNRETTFKGLGTLTFTLNNREHTLNAYEPPAFLRARTTGKVLFVPFYDKTNGISTFEGGRYLDLSLEADEQIKLDFNKAYNPFCKYNTAYYCPEPPEENRLDIKIPAGEKVL